MTLLLRGLWQEETGGPAACPREAAGRGAGGGRRQPLLRELRGGPGAAAAGAVMAGQRLGKGQRRLPCLRLLKCGGEVAGLRSEGPAGAGRAGPGGRWRLGPGRRGSCRQPGFDSCHRPGVRHSPAGSAGGSRWRRARSVGAGPGGAAPSGHTAVFIYALAVARIVKR